MSTSHHPQGSCALIGPPPPNATLLHLDHPLPGVDSTETGLAERLEERDRERLPEEAIEHTSWSARYAAP